ncbi:hypothetical protein AB7Y49_07860 [Providencia vermicola]|uniref:Peptidase C80 domain-containing protein n=1 Tax=Providencia vermicola TaxID=333965 RepID=A0AAX3RZ79_9GAMM|nr:MULTISPECIES: hypothetical protein [Providencia]ELX8379238.1 hypothetical protein [Providencia stuartii]EMD5258442.1 hypothetical protein [Providencia stuartii]USB38535.1 hypothetical protein M5J11_08685 [Providencia vermicola]WFC07472.1 hypothetical protein PG365_03520 [Providencia vermicola]
MIGKIVSESVMTPKSAHIGQTKSHRPTAKPVNQVSQNATVRSSGYHNTMVDSNTLSVAPNIIKLKNNNETFSLPSKNAVIYSPFGHQDMICQALRINTPRVLKNKAALPLLSSKLLRPMLQESVREFKKSELQGKLKNGAVYDQKLTPLIAEHGLATVHDAILQGGIALNKNAVTVLGEYKALNQLQLELKSSQKIDTIYVIGHGEAGQPYLYETSKIGCRQKHVADVMKEIYASLGNKIASNVKIKLTACESADAERLDSFNQLTQKKRIDKNHTHSLAAHAKIEAQKVVPEARIYGYHGIGISRGSDYLSKAQCLDSDFDSKTGQVTHWVNAKSVRETF